MVSAPLFERGRRYIYVSYRGLAQLVVPIEATNLRPALGRANSKLTLDAIAELVALFEEGEAACRSTPESFGADLAPNCAPPSLVTLPPSSGR